MNTPKDPEQARRLKALNKQWKAAVAAQKRHDAQVARQVKRLAKAKPMDRI